MNVPANPGRLRHIPVRLRVTVDPAKWPQSEDLADDVRRFVVAAVKASSHGGAIIDARRDRL